jgi:hypothetical protein
VENGADREGYEGMIPYLLNIADLAFTLYARKLGVPELNPLMMSVPVMVFHKVVVIGLLCWWLSYKQEKSALTLITVAYATVVVWHIINIL